MGSGDEILNKIAEALLADYSNVYYVNTVTNEYRWYFWDPKYKELQLDASGEDFFASIVSDADRVIHEDDRAMIKERFRKDRVLEDLKSGSVDNVVYRIMINGVPVYHTLRFIRGKAEDADYFILGIRNIDEEYRRMMENEQINAEKEIYGQIAESLASKYTAIYYVNAKEDTYIEFSATQAYRLLHIPKSGTDFFNLSKRNIDRVIHPEDRSRMHNVINKDYIITSLDSQNRFHAEYRLIINGQVRFTRFTAMWSRDRNHFIFAVENIDAQIRKEKEQLEALRIANELARRDELTGVSNNTALRELVNIIQADIDKNKAMPFAIVVCDVNDLKYVNDTYGHKAGDDSIKAACRKICSVFSHSPVFRFGGDEFVVILTGNDLDERASLMEQFRQIAATGSKDHVDDPVVASGIAVYDVGADRSVTDIFERADASMYANKKSLKELR